MSKVKTNVLQPSGRSGPFNSTAISELEREQRRDERMVTVMRITRITSRTGETLAIIRNISRHGMMLEVHPNFDLDDEVGVDLGDGHIQIGKVRWRKKATLGLYFAAPIDVDRVLAKSSTSSDGLVTRLPRIQVNHSAKLEAGDRLIDVDILDISVGGACLDLQGPAKVGDAVVLYVPSLQDLPGVIRWRRGSRAGVAFSHRVPLDLLIHWLSGYQAATAPAHQPDEKQPTSATVGAGPEAIALEAERRAAMVVLTDVAGKIISVNARFCEISGYSESELLGRRYRDLQSVDLPPAQLGEKLKCLVSGGIWEGEHCNRTKNGEPYWVETTIVPNKNRHGEITSYTYIHFDITDQKQDPLDPDYFVKFDYLTRLPNRVSFFKELDHTIARHSSEPGNIFLGVLDLDNFKHINDSLGHTAGDQVLIEVSRRLNETIAAGDTLARLGGDEFAFILRVGRRETDWQECVERLQSRLRDPIALPSGDIKVTASIGLVRVTGPATESLDLLRYADIALYAAKENGRNRVELCARPMLEKVERRAWLRDNFNVGLNRGEFTIFYEPIVGLHGHSLPHFEALFRWHHPQGGLLPASDFQEIFSEESLAGQVGRFVIGEVIAQIAAWRAAQVPFAAISVNTTIADFRTPLFVDEILGAISKGVISSADICVEITEDVLISDGAHCLRAEMSRLHHAGVKLLFDDFGTGYASLRHLRDMPISAVKIDQSFIRSIVDDEVDRGVVEHIISLSHFLGKQVIAEGVESSQQLDLLREIGCDAIQGYFVSRGQPADQIPLLADQLCGAFGQPKSSLH